jgi:prephenate dehydratase
MRIAIQGEPGSFSHEATLKMEPHATVVPCPLSAEVFRRLIEGDVDAAVIPIENSLAGPVAEHYDLLLQNDVLVVRESLLRIRHNFIVVHGSTMGRITRVFSHPVALAQCRRFLETHPEMEALPFYDTAGSVKQIVSLRERHAAAIASEEAARYYGGEILEAGIEDNPENFTRFFLVRRAGEVEPPSGADKVSIAFSVANQPGTLVAALQVFAARGLNLTKIESRPVQGSPWQYIFYADYHLPAESDAGIGIRELRQHCSMVKELGRYVEAKSHI